MPQNQVIGTAGDFSAIDHYPFIFKEIQQIWAQPKQADLLKAPHLLLECILENQGMKLIPELDQFGRCVGWKCWFEQDCDRSSNKSATFDTSIGCDIPEGPESQIGTIDYEENCFIRAARTMNDQECDNRLYGINASAEKLLAIIESLREGLAEAMAAFMTANAQVNTWNGTYGNIVGTQTQFTGAEFGDLKLLYHIQKIAEKNGIRNYKIVNGSNFWELMMQAVDGKCCGDASDRTRLTRYPMVFDMDMDDYIGRESTFIFDGSQIGFSNTPRYDNNAPVLQHDLPNGGGLWGWSVIDPDLQYRAINENGSTVMRNVRYDIEYKRVCTGRNKRGEFMYKHTWAGFFNGGHYCSPHLCGTGSGILEFVNIR